MRSILLKRFTKLVKIILDVANQKLSHVGNFPFSFCLNLYQSTILKPVKTFLIKLFRKALKISTKACNEQFKFKLEVDASMNITYQTVLITYLLYQNSTN